MRIALGGIQTECSTYSRIRSRESDFRVARGVEILHLSAFQFLTEFSVELIPTFFGKAVPGGPIEPDTYERFKNEFLAGLKDAGRLDGLYLAMHGAMFVEGMQDAEGDWISAAREVVGEDCLIAASYDLHGNLSKRIIDAIDMLSAFRTAPHIDVEETMHRTFRMLVQCLDEQIRPVLVWTPVPVLMPGERSSTVDEPAKTLYSRLPEINSKPGVLDVSLLVGYVWADEPRATASVTLTGRDANVLAEEARQLAGRYWEVREEFRFGVPVGTVAQCLEWAEAAETSPVILADSGDNPTGGGVGDRAEVLQALLERGFTNALVAGIADAPATDACYGSAPGRMVRLSIGGTLDPLGSYPVVCDADILFLLPTDDTRERQAVVRIEGITVVLTARRRPFHYLQDFARLNLDPAKFKLLVVKSGYLSPELAPIAKPNLMALSDGAINQDIEGLPKNIFRPPTFPFDRAFTWAPQAYVGARSSQTAVK